MVVEELLFVNTKHIREHDMNLLADDEHLDCRSYGRGVLIRLFQKGGWMETASAHMAEAGYSLATISILRMAHFRCLDGVWFDAEGTVYDSWPVFDWETP